jgi:hypothetical protein
LRERSRATARPRTAETGLVVGAVGDIEGAAVQADQPSFFPSLGAIPCAGRAATRLPTAQ